MNAISMRSWMTKFKLKLKKRKFIDAPNECMILYTAYDDELWWLLIDSFEYIIPNSAIICVLIMLSLIPKKRAIGTIIR